MSKDSNDVSKALGWLFVLVVVLIALVPKPVWIALGVVTAATLLIWAIVRAVDAYEKRRAAAEEQARVEQAARAAATRREREEKVRKEKQLRIETLGKENATLVESALAAVEQVGASEAAREGWLGDVAFTIDIRAITDNFEKAYALRRVAGKLSALDKPGPDDRKILAEAKTTAANLEVAALERAGLIERCAKEARLIDESLAGERKDARTAEQRAELHAHLSAMLYGIEATPNTAPADSAADAVMARVQAYREIKNQIQLARDGRFQTSRAALPVFDAVVVRHEAVLDAPEHGLGPATGTDLAVEAADV